MTHLSDYSYIDRGLQTIGILLFFVHRLTSQQQWKVFKPAQLRKLELRSLVSFLLATSLLLLISYDIITTFVKYTEGFEIVEDTGAIRTKSKSNYTPDNLSLIQKTDLVWNLACTFKSSALFLLLAMFHHTVQASGHTFMSSREFLISKLYACVSVCAYPLLQFIFYQDPLLSTIMPQFVYSFECFAIVALTQAANCRFRKLSQSMPSSSLVARRISAFIGLNNLLSISCFMDGLGLATINIDIVVTSWRNILHNKFATDLLTKVFNLGFSGTFVVMIVLLLPKKSISRKSSMSDLTGSQTGSYTGGTRHGTLKRHGTTTQSKSDTNPPADLLHQSKKASSYRVAPLPQQPIDLEAQARLVAGSNN